MLGALAVAGRLNSVFLHEAEGSSELFDIGYKLHSRGQYDKARDAFQRTIDDD